MANLKCPKCESTFSADAGWAKSAVSLLIAAPAVPDMATQVRCPNCHHVFAEGDIRYLRSSWPKGLRTGLAVIAILVIAWVVYRVFLP